MKTLVDLLLWLGSALASIILTILVSDRIRWMLAGLLGGLVPRGQRSIRGAWRAKYSYTSSRGEKQEEQLIELRQLGKYVWGRNLTGSAHWYKIRGTLHQETYVTGVWESVSEGNIYHGAFQLILNAAGHSMSGKWLGFNNRHEINDGYWELKRVKAHAGRAVK